MADYPLRSATDRRLGRPLPYQLTNQTQAHPVPINLWRFPHAGTSLYEVLIPVSRGYPPVRGRLPTRYSPVRRSPCLHLNEFSFRHFPLDLHVLGTPPAFILSQDQTLCKWYLNTFAFKSSFSLFGFTLVFILFRIIVFSKEIVL